MALARHRYAPSVGSLQYEAYDVTSESAGAVVILAMDIVGQGPAEGHETRPRGHAGEKPEWRERGEDVVERDAGFGHEDPGCRIERAKAIETRHIEEAPTVREAHIAIGTPSADREASRFAAGIPPGLVTKARAGNGMTAFPGPAP